MTLDQKPVSLQLWQHNNTHSTTPMPSAVQIKGGNQPMFPGGPYANILPLLLAYQMGNFGLLQCNGRIFYLFILSYRVRLSYLITALVLSLLFIYGCGLVSS